jgi:hypothetical protein
VIQFPKRWTKSAGLAVHNIAGTVAGKAGSNAVFRGLRFPLNPAKAISAKPRMRLGPFVPRVS